MELTCTRQIIVSSFYFLQKWDGVNYQYMHLTIGNDCEQGMIGKPHGNLRFLRLKQEYHPGIYPSCLDNPLPSLCCILLRLLRVDLGQGMRFGVRKTSAHV